MRVVAPRRGAARVAVACALALSAASCGTADGPAGTTAERLGDAFAEIDDLGISAVLTIAQGDQPPTVHEFGAARDDRVPGAATQVDLNSVTKTVTAAMVLKLVEQDKLTVQSRLAELLPDVPPDKADITVHQLLTHTAGFVESVGDDAEPLGRDEFLRRALATPLEHEPGGGYLYTNVGYSILAAIVELRSGMGYEQYLRTAVLAPLGLRDTGYAGVYDEARALRGAKGETIRDGSWGGHPPFWNLVGNGGLISTPADFVQFRRAFATGRIVPATLVEQAQRPYAKEDLLGTSHYGYGMVVVPERRGTGRYLWHDGGNNIFGAKWTDYADRDTVVFAAVADSGDTGVTEVTDILERHLYGG